MSTVEIQASNTEDGPGNGQNSDRNSDHSMGTGNNGDNNGGDDVFTDGGRYEKVTHKHKKRKRHQNSSTDTVDIDQFKSLSVDDKLGVLFKSFHTHSETMANIESKIDSCLQLKSCVKSVKSSLIDHDDRSPC